MCLGLLGIGSDLEVPDESSAAVVIEHKLNELHRSAAAHGMRHMCLGGDGVGTVEEGERVDLSGAAFTELGDGDIV